MFRKMFCLFLMGSISSVLWSSDYSNHFRRNENDGPGGGGYPAQQLQRELERKQRMAQRYDDVAYRPVEVSKPVNVVESQVQKSVIETPRAVVVELGWTERIREGLRTVVDFFKFSDKTVSKTVKEERLKTGGIESGRELKTPQTTQQDTTLRNIRTEDMTQKGITDKQINSIENKQPTVTGSELQVLKQNDNKKVEQVREVNPGPTLIEKFRGAVKLVVEGIRNTFQKMVGAILGMIDWDIYKKQAPIEYDKKGPAVLTIGGMFNTFQDAKILNLAVQNIFGVKTATYIRNDTNFIGDFVQSLGYEYLGMIDKPVMDTAKAIKQAIVEKGEVYVVAHSQGTAIFKQALKLLSAEEKSKIHYLGLGSEWNIDAKAEGLADAKNVKNKMDFVPWLGNRLKAITNVIFPWNWSRLTADISDNGSKRGFDHLFENYRDAVSEWARRFGYGRENK